MIYFTGDIHGDPFVRFSSGVFPEGRDLTKNDYVVIAGDFGCIWRQEMSDEEQYRLEWLNNKPWTTLFVDGNHECVNKDTEILTENGWINVEELYDSFGDSLENIKIANYDLETKKIYYDYPIEKIKNYSEKIIDILSPNYKQSVSPGHDVLIDGKKIKASQLIGKKIRESSLRNYVDFDEKIDLNPKIIEILTTIIMDGAIVDYNKSNPNSHKVRIQYHLKKQRKINYIINILDDSNIKYTVRTGKNNDTFICIYGEQARYLYSLLNNKKEIPDYFKNMNLEQFKYLLNAIIQTDGHPIDNNVIWSTTNLNDVNLIQELCIKHNYDMRVSRKEHTSGYKFESKPIYMCSIGYNKRLINYISINERAYNDYVYCFSMPKGTIITRYNYTACITGNCFTRINSYPVEEWHGGKVHKIMPSVIHLMRGEIYDINGYSLFAFGGARSHDIKDGILEIDDPLLQKWRYDWYKMFRINNYSWWKEEVPTSDEMQYALDNLAKHDWKVDYIVTHERPTFIYPRHYKPNVLSDYLEIIRQATNFGTWISGHHHENIIRDKYAMLYERIIPIFDNNDNKYTYHHNDIVFDKEWFQKRLDDEYNEIMERKNRP